jgi:protein SCO1/2
MKDRPILPRTLLIISGGALLLCVLAMFVIDWAVSSQPELPVLGTVPAFEFTERSGQPFGTADMAGKINLIYFGFTQCQGPCPTLMVHMHELYDLYAHSEQVQFIKISVDPERDSLEALKQYAAANGITDDRWLFLRAPMEDVVKLSEEGFMLAAHDLPMGHSTKFILVDHEGRIRKYYDGLDRSELGLIKQHVRALARAM